MLVLDRDLSVVEGNEAFWEDVCASPPAPPGTQLEDALPRELLAAMQEPLTKARETGESVTVEGVRLYTVGHPQRVMDLRVAPARLGEAEVLMIAASAVPDSGRRVAELTLLNDMIRVLRRELELDRVLFATLTCATAGGGLALNRAFVLLVDADGQWLQGRAALGPASAEEASRIWTEISAHPRPLEEFAAAYDRWARIKEHPLQSLVSRLRFSMEQDSQQVPVLATVQRTTIKIDDAEHDERVSRALFTLLGSRQLVVAPLLVADEPRGAIIADNLYSGASITDGNVRLLSLFAQHAGIVIEGAQTYHEIKAAEQELERAYAELKEAQEELVQAERLAALGEMAARVAHDFRNPIVTIGGWARDLEEAPDDREAVLRAAGVVAEEAARLESILSMLVEPLAARTMRLEPTDLNQLIANCVLVQRPSLAPRGIEVEVDLSEELPLLDADPAQLRRVIVNLLDNAQHAMPDGGKLSIATHREDREALIHVADTGIGMPEEVVSQIFRPFFSTDRYGCGLGLANVRDIIQSHGWDIQAESQLGAGTVFTIRIPLGPTEQQGTSTPRSE